MNLQEKFEEETRHRPPPPSPKMSLDSHVFGSADFNAQAYMQRYWEESASVGENEGGEREGEGENEGLVRRGNSSSGIGGLRGDLLLHLRDLRLQLIELINRDYADFINLSTNLVGVDKALEQLRGPLQSLAVSVKERFHFLFISSLSSKEISKVITLFLLSNSRPKDSFRRQLILLS